MKQKYTGRVCGAGKFSGGREAHELQSGGDYIGVVAKSGKPVHVRLLAEPGDLALGKAARGLLDFLDDFSERAAARDLIAQIRVADELKRLRVGGTRRLRVSLRTSSTQPAAIIAFNARSRFVRRGIRARARGRF